ncbi:MAG: aminotransferase class I/II-fold pyridoxal phosphate-dependent enzyme, partial [Candidatus Heimdallarchaeota archaeon]|nr:aminotransferase class I/II-fold pyridoxal phosphate-dependent enzyme [Candidatus Heimdallarchaeota archaeon]
KPARKTENIIYAIRNIVTYAKQLEKDGLEVTYLNIGDPIVYDFDTPEHMKQAVSESMKAGENGYSSSYGTDKAREAIAKDEQKKGSGRKDVTTNDVIVSSGASEGIEIALTALLNPEDNILLPLPGYPLYSAVIAKIGTTAKGYILDNNNNWQPNLADIEKLIDKNTKAIVVINPNNPTGVFYGKETMKGIVELAKKYNLLIFSDEIYDKLIIDDMSMTYFTDLTDDVPIVSFNGLSKSYLAPGWRIGWMVFHNMQNETEYIGAIRRIAEARLCSPAPLQGAIPTALLGDQSHIKEVISKLRKRRDITFERLNAINRVHCVRPQAAFYAMATVEGINDDEVFIKDLLRATGVLFVYGSGFGLPKDMGSFRIVFLPDKNTLHKAYDKFEKFLKTY